MERAAWIVHRYESVARLSREMLQAARLEQWDELVDLERQRDLVLSELRLDVAQAAIPAEVADLVAKLMAECLTEDEETIGLTQAWQVELQGLLGSVSTERRLLDTYGK